MFGGNLKPDKMSDFYEKEYGKSWPIKKKLTTKNEKWAEKRNWNSKKMYWVDF